MPRTATAFALILLFPVFALADVNSIGMNLTQVPADTFLMGSDKPGTFWDEQPVHRVTISQSFYVSDLVTIDQYRKFKPGRGAQ